ncbi:MAG: hypothetical protein WCD35_10655 [Mycobacteriales bacterium]
MIIRPTGIGPARPLRVHVLGNSTAAMVEPEHGPRDGGVYGEQLVRLLAERGTPCVVTSSSAWMSMVSEHLPRYEQDVRNRFPDVLVLNLGVIESQPGVLPLGVTRHLLTWNRSSRRPAELYRARVAPTLWRGLRGWQRWASSRDRGRTHRLGPRRFTTDLHRLIDLVRKDCGSLVLVLDIDPPGDRVEHWLPTARARAAHYDQLLEQVAYSYDEHVRFVRAGALLTDPAAQLPDGLHRTAEAHGTTAALLADEICRWLES